MSTKNGNLPYGSKYLCNLTIIAFTNLDHFGDINEMVFDTLPTIKTGCFGLLYYLLKIAIIAVSEYLRKILTKIHYQFH
jgi:hypothetical protein